MAREAWEHEQSEEKPEKPREGGKTVRFVSSETCDKNGGTLIEQTTQNPVSMVQSLVPHLPGLDKDTIYVISGPFPNYDPVSGPSQLLMATPISPGVTVVAVPLGPPPAVPNSPVQGNAAKPIPHHVNGVPANHLINHTHNSRVRRDSRPPQPGPRFQPQPPQHHGAPVGPHGHVGHPPHMLHWDTFHPVGQTIPLRQPNPPVYYNVPSPNSSGMQSPGSDGSSMSCSDISEDQEDGHRHNVYYYQPTVPQMMGFPQHIRPVQGHTQCCNLNQQGHMFPQHHGHPIQNFNQGYIS